MKASELLERAKAAYETAECNYRDALLECGRLLHEFVVAYLKEGDGLSREIRLDRNLTRRKAVGVAAESMGVKRGRINQLISAGASVPLLSGGEPLDRLGFGAIDAFRPLLRRKIGTKDYTPWADAEGAVSEAEAWEVKERYHESGPALFRQAVAGGWSAIRTRGEVATLLRGKPVIARRRTVKRETVEAEEASPVSRVRESIRHASPGDAAETCLEIIMAAEDPWAVAQRLMPRLAKIKKRAREMMAC